MLFLCSQALCWELAFTLLDKLEFALAVLNIMLGISIHPSVVPEFLRTLVFARPRGDDQFADCTFSPSLDMSR